MKSLIKTVLIMIVFFAATFIIGKLTGIFSLDLIKVWLELLKDSSPLILGILISLLLFADLFVAMPTLSLCILSGYFLGYQQGFTFSLIGVTGAGVVGYLISHKFGEKLLSVIIKDEKEKLELKETFSKHGFGMIVLSRALPILPEVSACLSGMTKMKMRKFITAWLISSVPYIAIASYSGSISTLDDPKPAIFTAIGLSLFFWICWFFLFEKD